MVVAGLAGHQSSNWCDNRWRRSFGEHTQGLRNLPALILLFCLMLRCAATRVESQVTFVPQAPQLKRTKQQQKQQQALYFLAPHKDSNSNANSNLTLTWLLALIASAHQTAAQLSNSLTYSSTSVRLAARFTTHRSANTTRGSLPASANPTIRATLAHKQSATTPRHATPRQRP